MDSNIIAIMFEEIKQLIAKLLEQKKSTETEAEKPPSIDITPIVDLLKEAQSSTIKQSNHISNQLLLFTKKYETLIREREAYSKEVIDNFQKGINHTHQHSIDYRTSSIKVIGIFIGLITILSISIFINIKQNIENREFTDNDIKYRYIKMYGGINNRGIEDLESIFTYRPDINEQKRIIEQIREYEQKLEQRAIELERLNIRSQKANQLEQEIIGIKEQ